MFEVTVKLLVLAYAVTVGMQLLTTANFSILSDRAGDVAYWGLQALVVGSWAWLTAWLFF